MILLAHLLRWLLHKRTQDLEACHHPLLSEVIQTAYDTFALSSQQESLGDAEVRRMLRRERVRDHISGVYQISVRRLEDDEVSLSSDSSWSEEEGESCGVGEGAEADSSESESSEDSESESDDEAEMKRLLALRRSALPTRITALRGMGN